MSVTRAIEFGSVVQKTVDIPKDHNVLVGDFLREYQINIERRIILCFVDQDTPIVISDDQPVIPGSTLCILPTFMITGCTLPAHDETDALTEEAVNGMLPNITGE